MKHSMSKLLRAALFTGAVISTGSLVRPAHAQDAESQERNVLDEVVVTARMRVEPLFEIPLAISAFSSDEIKKGGYQDLGDIAKHTPGVDFDPRSTQGFGGRSYSNIRIRGAQVAGVSPSQQSTSAFIDGVFVLGGINSIPLNDLERVEVIKGPQSAYFGRNTFAGAINYITRNPSLQEYETEIEASVADHDQYEVSGLTSGPLIEGKLGYLVSGRSMQRGALFTAADGGGLGEESTNSISGVLYWEPDDKWSVKLRAMILRDEDGAPANGYLKGSDYNTCAGKVYPGRFADDGSPYTIDFTNGRPNGSPVNYICGKPLGINSPLARVSMNTRMQPTIFSLVDGVVDTSGRGFSGPPNPNLLYDVQEHDGVFSGVPYLSHIGLKRDNQRFALNVNYNFSNGLHAELVAAKSTQDLQDINDFDRQDVEAYWAENPSTFDDTSVDLRLTSAQDRRFRWLVGATQYEQKSVTGAGGATTLVVGQISAGFTGIIGTTATGGDKATVVGLYGGASFDFSDKLTLDAEVRAMRDTRTTSVSAMLVERDYESVTPRFILSYRFNEDTNLYGQYSLGTLPGQVNAGFLTCSQDDFLVPYEDPLNPGSFIVLSECGQYERMGARMFTSVQKLDAWEVGLKKKFLDGRLSLSAAAYYWEWAGKPSAISMSLVRDAANPANRDGIPDPFPVSVGASVDGSSTMKGVELEGAYRITDRWEANFGFSYTDTEWSEFSSGAMFQVTGTRNQKGNEEPWVPQLKGSLSTTYTREFNSDWDWFGRLDVVWQGNYYGDPENLLEGPSWSLTNVRAGFDGQNGLRLELFVRNLFDEDAWRQVGRGIDYSRQPADFNFTNYWGASLVPQEPRTIGLRASMRF